MNAQQTHLAAIKENVELGNLAAAQGQAKSYSRAYRTTANERLLFGRIDAALSTLRSALQLADRVCK